MVNLKGLINLLNEHSWTAIECFSILDFWTGLVNSQDIYELIRDDELLSCEDQTEMIHLELKLKIDIVLQQLINRFVSVCPHTSKSEHLRQPPAFVILPAGNSTAIAGIAF
jgi:hypothetical protein